jgi:hypothetical protein
MPLPCFVWVVYDARFFECLPPFPDRAQIHLHGPLHQGLLARRGSHRGGAGPVSRLGRRTQWQTLSLCIHTVIEARSCVGSLVCYLVSPEVEGGQTNRLMPWRTKCRGMLRRGFWQHQHV